MNIIVIGLGQSLRGDDGAGLEAVRLWAEKYPETARRPEVRVKTAELPGLGLLDLLEGMQAAVLVDAVQADRPAGSLLRLGLDDLAAFVPGSGSAHGWGVAESLQLGRSLSLSLEKCRITLIGIQIGQADPGAGLSPQVEAALEDACQAIEREVHAFLI